MSLIFSGILAQTNTHGKIRNNNYDLITTDLGVDNVFIGKQAYCDFYSRDITAVVRNYGTDPVANFNVSIFRNGIEITSISNTETLYPGEFIDIYETSAVSLSNSDSTYIMACVDLQNDQNPGNDCYEKAVPAIVDSSLCHPEYIHGVNSGGFINYLDINGSFVYPPQQNEYWRELYGFCAEVYPAINEIKLIAESDGVYVSGWIDFNSDHQLSGDEQVLDCGFLEFAWQEYSFQFAIPPCIHDRNLKMRIRTNTAGCPDHPCDTLFSGYTVDFMVNNAGAACGFDVSLDTVLIPGSLIEASEIIPAAVVGNPNCANSNVFGADVRITRNSELVYYSYEDEIVLCADSSASIQFEHWQADTGNYACKICTHSAEDNYLGDNCKTVNFGVVTEKIFDLKVYLEGPFVGIEMGAALNINGFIPVSQPYNTPPWNYSGNESVPAIPNSDIVDWVLVELRETAGDASQAFKENVVATQAGFILKDGSIVSVDGASPLQFDITVNHKLYAVVHHRNHLSVISGNELTENGGVYSYDFSTGSSQALGNSLAHKEIGPGVWGMVSGDGNANGQVDNVDKNDIWVPQAGLSGYYAGDFSMNGQVDNADKIDLWSVNSGRSSQAPGGWACGDPLFDPRDGELYSTVVIGAQCWMAKNLNTGLMIPGTQTMSDDGVIEKYCYDNDPANCDSYGGLYQWGEAMTYENVPNVQGICPPVGGWHIPDDDQWKILEGMADSQYGVGNPIWDQLNARGFDVGLNLKSTSAWGGNGNGADLYGFTGWPAGERLADGVFINMGGVGNWWTSTPYDQNDTYIRYFHYLSDLSVRNWFEKSRGFSLRCVLDSIYNQPPAPPSDPLPPDNAQDEPVDTQLSWICSDPENDPLTFDVYFGTVDPPPYAGQVALPAFDPGQLDYMMQYFWKIVAYDIYGNFTEGPVWSFTITPNLPPVQPYNPSPPDNATDQPTDVQLSWQCSDPENDPLSYDVYFGDANPPPLVSPMQASPSFDPGSLDFNNQYYWKIIAHDNYWNMTESPLWTFTTLTGWLCGDPLVDTRDGRIYSTVQIGTQCWMAENLNYGIFLEGYIDQADNSIPEKYCLYDEPAKCDEYGGLYQWPEAMQYSFTPGVQGLCPDGWYLPADQEWCTLEQFVDPTITCSSQWWRGVDGGGKLKETGYAHWSIPNTGATNSSGFTALPGGFWDHVNTIFDGDHINGLWWTSTDSGGYTPWMRMLSYNKSQIYRYKNANLMGYSVRCVRD